ncbi:MULTISPECIES: GntR family transcriptional regulator [unclassified Streptomyces]|uniref:GntR family transcriptional regulator n=1 Tax=unclassified Streptomyces TaxID=2593676 RepID=UPI002E1413F6|nr:GntR family transcriptional regulator [Streptomyces sp. NBC_01197]WSS50651.1 GntR family transcriptional regulator [Streptomyces sp. NBC_01180]
MPASGAVTRSTLRQQIADALRDEVLAGRLQPGEVFTVKQIAEGYGVSATPVREALVEMSAQGLLDSDQHKGFRVHQFSVDDYCAMVEARSLIIDGIFRRLTLRGVAGEPLLSVRRRAEEAGQAARSGSLEILIGYDLRFWRELGALTGNSYISDFLHRLRVQCWVFAVPYLRGRSELTDWLWQGHEELADAVTSGDGDQAHAVIDAYNAQAVRWAEQLRATGAAPPPGGAPPEEQRPAAGPSDDGDAR